MKKICHRRTDKMSEKQKEVQNFTAQEEPGNGLLSGGGVGKTDSKKGAVPVKQTMEEAAANPYPDLRSHEGNYVATNRKSYEAVVSVCCSKTGKKVTVSVKHAKRLIGYRENDWLDVKYSDSAHTVLIGKAVKHQGIFPRFTEKKHIIYDASTVTDFAETLQLDFSNCFSRSAYSCQIVELEGRPYIALTHDDFV